MGNISSWMFPPRRCENLPDGNGGGSRQGTDLEVSITENVQIETRDRPTHNTGQLEENGNCRGTGEAQAQSGGSGASKRGTKRGATTESCARKKTKRCKNWTPAETQTLIECRSQASLEKGKLELWEAIAAQIPGKTGKQCQRRWDTVVKHYKKINLHCDTLGKDFSQVTGEELVSMKVDNHWKRNNWYNLIDEYYRPRASPAAGTEGAADLDPPASTSSAVRDVDGSGDPVTFWSNLLLDSAE